MFLDWSPIMQLPTGQIIYRSERLVAFMFCKITHSLYVAKQLKAGSLYVH